MLPITPVPQPHPPGRRPSSASRPPMSSSSRYHAPDAPPQGETARNTPMKRPGQGHVGRPIDVDTNFFRLRAPNLARIFQYCVFIEALRVPEPNPGGAHRGCGGRGRGEDELRKKWVDISPASLIDFNRDVFHYFCHHNIGSNTLLAYDGRKTAYAASEIPPSIDCGIKGNEDARFSVVVDRDGVVRDVGKGDEDRSETMYVRIKKVTTIDCRPVLKNDQHDVLESSSALAAIDTVLSCGPLKEHVQVGRSFFHPQGAKSLRGGVEAWRGFYQSARLSQNGLLINMDESRTPFWSCGGRPLSALLDEMNMRVSTSDPVGNKRVARLLAGLKVRADHNKITYRVHGFSDKGADEITFHDEQMGRMVSVREYFYHKYKCRLQDGAAPCVVTNPRKKTLLPLEILYVVPRQRVVKGMTPEQTANMIRAAATKPRDRRSGALAAIRRVNHKEDPVCRNFNITVDRDAVSLRARVLPAPAIQYDSGVDKPVFGQWDRSHRHRLYLGAPLLTWCVLNLTRARDDVIKRFVDRLIGKAREMGMDSTRRVEIYHANNRPVESALRNIHADFQDPRTHVDGYPLQLILIIKWKQDTETYNTIKRVCDVELGVVTQVMLEKHLVQKRPNDSYCGNLILKINAKLGGTNTKVQPYDTRNTDMVNVPFLRERHIVLGADVTHPASGGSRPSVAALVGTRDANGSQFSSSIRNMPPRQELMTEMGEMFSEVYYQWYHNYPPDMRGHAKSIIMFRDGVSEGQFEQVMDHELDGIRRACHKIDKSFNPKITYIIVTKRHHARFFPRNQRDAEKSGNIPAGTVVDTDVVSSQYYDFYLNSHSGIQGTSRPSKYTVLVDENHIPVDALQGYIFRLAHAYARCNRSVSIVNSAYYAHLLAFRGRAYLEDDSDASSSHRSDQSNNITKVDPHQSLRRHLYYI